MPTEAEWAEIEETQSVPPQYPSFIVTSGATQKFVMDLHSLMLHRPEDKDESVRDKAKEKAGQTQAEKTGTAPRSKEDQAIVDSRLRRRLRKKKFGI